MFHFQCVVSDGHTSTLAIVKGANVNIIETIKVKDLVKKCRSKDEQFQPGKRWYSTEEVILSKIMSRCKYVATYVS